MNLDPVLEYTNYSKTHFDEGMSRAGFHRAHDREEWTGSLPHRSGPTEVTVTLPDRFPFVPPRAYPVDQDWAAWSWHRECDGAMCLVAEDDHEDLWWIEADQFLNQVERWLIAADDNWKDDRTDLDIERYFAHSTDTALYVYGELGPLKGRNVRFTRSTNGVMILKGTGVMPTKHRASKKERWGYVADLGALTQPPRTWKDLAALLAPDAAREIEQRRVDTLVVTYLRGDVEGAAVYRMSIGQGSQLVAHTLKSAPNTSESLRARSGRQANLLSTKRVAVIGMGAVGSFTTDLLARAGVEQLVLVDYDVLKPGNTVRHLLGKQYVGQLKTRAMRTHLINERGLQPELIETREGDAVNADLINDLIETCDLVIDASADFSVGQLTRAVAERHNNRFLMVGLQNDGDTARTDVVPPYGKALPLPSSARPRSSSTPYFEAGCGSPISPTPPQSVVEAAAIACRHAVAMLVGQPLTEAGEVTELAGHRQ